MITLSPNILEKDGKKEFVVLTYEEFLRVEEALQELADLQLLREAKQLEKDVNGQSLTAVAQELGITLES